MVCAIWESSGLAELLKGSATEGGPGGVIGIEDSSEVVDKPASGGGLSHDAVFKGSGCGSLGGIA